MINENIWETIELLIKDAEFLDGFQRKLNDYNNQNIPEEKQKAMQIDAFVFMMHVVDYYATIKKIDMDGDLARLCKENPSKAERLSKSMNKSALTLKVNYQWLLMEGSFFANWIKVFPELYRMRIEHLIRSGNDKDEMQSAPFLFNIPYSELELISANNDKSILYYKCRMANEMELTVESVKEYIDHYFEWSDRITDYLNRMGEYKTVAQIDDGKLRKLYDFCIEQEIVSFCKPDHFARALRNEEAPKFHLYNKDTFYSIIYGVYVLLGKLGTRGKWRDEILVAFEIDRTSYSSLESRIKCGSLSKALKERYERIKEILEIDNRDI